MDLGLAGRCAIVTGAASGIGRETALHFAREGARLLVADRDAERLDPLVAELRAAGAEAESFAVDVRRYDECQAMAKTALERFGALDVLVAAAGVNREGLFLEQKPEDWLDLVDVNLRGVLHCNRAVAALMVERGRGAIVNVGSDAGKLGEGRMAVYSATKGGVIAFSKALAAELGRHGIRVNAVCPGVTQTPMIAAWTPEQREKAARLYPLRRLGEPDDIAGVIAFLASDRAGWLTGQAVSVNGGFARC
jgi:2-hydroxycyclohexanecarboxyl-CoA dehydrogenase